MSQPPSYQPVHPPGYGSPAPPGYSPQGSFWPYYLQAPDELLRPARRASLMLFLLAGLLLVGGTCAGFGAGAATDAQLNEALAEARKIDPQQAALFTPRVLRTTYGVLAAAVAMMGAVAIILGVVVRGGGRAATVTALVIVALPAAAVAVMLVGTLVTGPTAFLGAVLLLAVPVVLIAMTIVSLVVAIRAAPAVEAARQQVRVMQHQQAAQYDAYARHGQWPPQT